MPLSALLNRPCTIITREESGTLDDYGDPTKTETEVQTVCELQPRSAVEPEGDFSEDDFAGFFLPADHASLNSASAVRVDGIGTLEVAGNPLLWRSPRSQLDEYVQANLKRTAGPADA